MHATLTLPVATWTRLADVVDRSGLPTWLETELEAATARGAGTHAGGRRRVLSARALLVGMLGLATAGQPLILRDVVALLNAAHPTIKHSLGLPRATDGGVTEREVSYLFGRITTLLDPSKHSAANRTRYEARRDAARDQVRATLGSNAEQAELENAMANAVAAVRTEQQTWLAAKHDKLRYVLDRGLDATLPDGVEHTGSYAIDGSEVRTWARQNRRQPKAPWLHPDPDASWNGKAHWGRHGHTTGWYGYWLHGLVRVGQVGGPDTPCLVERIDVTPANADARKAGIDMLTRMVADHQAADQAAGRPDRARRDLLADRAYTCETRKADDWVWPAWALGFTSVHQLTENQLGQAKTRTRPSTGAVVVDGQPYSPRLPMHLRNLPQPGVGATRADIAAYQASVDQRAVYALHAVGGRNADGSWDFGCRAMALLGQLRCDLKPRSLTLPHTRPTTDPTVYTPANRLPKVCGQEKARITREQLPFWQPALYGSTAWYDSYNRRNRIEGIFGNLKNDAAQDLTRGNMRVMGLAKTSVLILVNVMAVNLRLLDRWAERQMAAALDASGTRPVVRRKPRRRTLLLEQTRANIEAARARAAQLEEHEPSRVPALV